MKPPVVQKGIEGKNSVVTTIGLLPTFFEASDIEMVKGFST